MKINKLTCTGRCHDAEKRNNRYFIPCLCGCNWCGQDLPTAIDLDVAGLYIIQYRDKPVPVKEDTFRQLSPMSPGYWENFKAGIIDRKGNRIAP